MKIIRYDSSKKNEWDSFVDKAKNATFLLLRDYMDYHSDRFTDCSLMAYNDKKLCALLPANINAKGSIVSHGGLTYGGLVLERDTHATDVLEIFQAMAKYMKTELGANELIYKPIPYIYCTQPSQEDLYALFRMGATLENRTISTTIWNTARQPFSQLRRRKIACAKKNELTFKESNDYKAFWDILTQVLSTQHGCTPVHTIGEIELLHSRFPNNIKLYTAEKEGVIIAGTVVYETPLVAHFQYIAASSEGKASGALDGMFAHLIEHVYTNKEYIDFGISTEEGGHTLNEGLIFQKEGFGGRGIVYDTYRILL